MAKQNIIPNTLLISLMSLLSTDNNLDKSSSVPLITFGMKIKEPLFVHCDDNLPHRMTWINGVYISMYGELCFTLSDNNSDYMADVSVCALPSHITKKYIKQLNKKIMEI